MLPEVCNNTKHGLLDATTHANMEAVDTARGTQRSLRINAMEMTQAYDRWTKAQWGQQGQLHEGIKQKVQIIQSRGHMTAVGW